MPPKSSKTQHKAASAANQDPCCICLQKFGPKDEVLFCSGSCQKYLHRYCASVSEQAFKGLASEDADPFLCFCCFKAHKEKQVASLLSTVESLKEEINALKAATAATASTINSSNTGSGERLSLPSSSPRHPTSSEEPALHKYQSGECPSQSFSGASNPDKKFNVVLYGMDECPSGMFKSARLEADLNKVVQVFASVDSSIQSPSIKDCFRLGKFSSSQSRPRPVLVKFVRIADVTTILSKKRMVPHPFKIKPDMTREQRVCESVLLKEMATDSIWCAS